MCLVRARPASAPSWRSTSETARRRQPGCGRGRPIRSDRQHLVDAFCEKQIERLAAVGGSLLRVQPDVVRQLLDVDERSGRILDAWQVIGRPGLGEHHHAAERPQLVADAEPGDQDARLRPLERLHRRPFDERVVHQERAVAGEQHVAHEREQDIGGVEQRARQAGRSGGCARRRQTPAGSRRHSESCC